MNKEQIYQATAIRKLNANDDLKQVADLIYYTDDYIFPYLFNGDVTAAEKVLRNMILGDTIYSMRDIYVAECGGKIAGIVILKTVPLRINAQNMIKCFLDAGQPVGERFAKVYNEYYKLLEDEQPDVYVANVCVDKTYRGMGIAKKLLDGVLRDDLTYHLECVKANQAGLKLYEKAGFEIDCEYPGFTQVPCYRMTKSKK